MHEQVETSAPGRICLFGEHQDYLGLPVIAAAIDLRVTLRARRRESPGLRMVLPDIDAVWEIDPNREQAYRHGRDYLAAAVNVLRREGLDWERGYDVVVRGQIPLNSGTSSSSALQVAWCSMLYALAGDMAGAEDADRVARAAHQSEVVEFGAPGGMMDHFSTAFGGVVWIDCRTPYRVEHLPTWPGEFVLVDSGIPKDTNGMLGSIRRSLESLKLSLFEEPSIQDESGLVNPLAVATMRNKALTGAARETLEKTTDSAELGSLLLAHHEELSARLGTSHPVIDDLIEWGCGQGALGGKINGSGGGGAFFLLCPGNGEEMRQRFATRGHRAWVVRVSDGLRVGFPDSKQRD